MPAHLPAYLPACTENKNFEKTMSGRIELPFPSSPLRFPAEMLRASPPTALPFYVTATCIFFFVCVQPGAVKECFINNDKDAPRCC